MKLTLKIVKTCVFGIQGSGKTYFVENSIIQSFKNPLIYLIHREDFAHCGGMSFYINRTIIV